MAKEQYVDMHHASFKAMLEAATNALHCERPDDPPTFLVSFFGHGGSASNERATEQVDTPMPSQCAQSIHLDAHHDALKAMTIAAVIAPRRVRPVYPRAYCRHTSAVAMLWLMVAFGTISPVACASTFTSRAALLDARDAWCADPAAAAVTYGHIADWEVSQVTDMSYLFCARSDSYYTALGCNSACANFNGNLSGWDTSKVTSMRVSKERVAAALRCHENTA